MKKLKIQERPFAHSLCESCFLIEKAKNFVPNELDKQLISTIICPGCHGASFAKNSFA